VLDTIFRFSYTYVAEKRCLPVSRWNGQITLAFQNGGYDPGALFEKPYQIQPLKNIQSYADLATHGRNPPQPPFAEGAGGISGGSFRRVKIIPFKKRRCYEGIFIKGRRFVEMDAGRSLCLDRT
jgi:hypothetical protein